MPVQGIPELPEAVRGAITFSLSPAWLWGWSCSRDGSASPRSQASPPQLLPEPISAPSSPHCPALLALVWSEVVLHLRTCGRLWWGFGVHRLSRADLWALPRQALCWPGLWRIKVLSWQIHAAFQSCAAQLGSGSRAAARAGRSSLLFSLGEKVEIHFSKQLVVLWTSGFKAQMKVFLPQKVDSRCNLKDSFQLSLVGSQKCPSSWIKHSNSSI